MLCKCAEGLHFSAFHFLNVIISKTEKHEQEEQRQPSSSQTCMKVVLYPRTISTVMKSLSPIAILRADFDAGFCVRNASCTIDYVSLVLFHSALRFGSQ